MTNPATNDALVSNDKLVRVEQRGNIIEIRTRKECHDLFSQKFAVIFKHSKTCDLSSSAYQAVAAFCAERPNLDVYLISVLDSPSASRFVEDRTNVRHQSPQVLAMQYGEVFAFASHRKVTSSFLADICAT